MQSCKKDDIEQPDLFSKEVGKKLREYSMDVDPEIWEALESKLPTQRRRMTPYWAWSAAAVALLLLGLFHFLNPPAIDTELEMVQSIPENKKMGQPQENLHAGESDLVQKEEISSSPLLFAQKTSPQKRQMKVAAMTASLDDAPDMDHVVSEEPVITPTSTTEIATAVEEMEADDLVAEAEDALTQQDEELAALLSSDDKQPHAFLLAMGSGNALPDVSFGDYDMYDSYYYGNPVPGAGFGQDWNQGSEAAYNLLTPADYSDIVHYLPVTLSVTADFPVGQKTSLETGLSYTYLYSRYSRNDRLVYRGTLQQHYVGVPVNLRYRVWQNDSWNFYLLGGASVEKGIRAIYKQDIQQQNGVVQHTNVYNSIAGLQFSVQGGAGFSYRLQNNLQLFGEPRLIYYFKNNQPLSSRTENPVIFGLNLGVRMQFK